MDSSIALIAGAAGSALIWQFSRRRVRAAAKPRARQSLLKPNLRYVYAQLREACGDDLSIQVDVPVARLLGTKLSTTRKKKSRRKPKRRVDFVMCEHETLRPRLVVLVGPADESSPSPTQRALHRQLEASGLPCLVIDPDREIDAEELSETIDELLADSAEES